MVSFYEMKQNVIVIIPYSTINDTLHGLVIVFKYSEY